MLVDSEELAIWENFTDQDEHEFRTVFEIFDTDGGGEIEENEIRMVFQSLGQNPTQEEVKQLIETVDEDGGGAVDFEEFLVLMAKQMRIEQDREEELIAVFRQFDLDGDGKISAYDLIEIFKQMGEKIEFNEANKMIKLCDKTKKDNFIQFSEFVKVMMYDTEDPTCDPKNY